MSEYFFCSTVDAKADVDRCKTVAYVSLLRTCLAIFYAHALRSAPRPIKSRTGNRSTEIVALKPHIDSRLQLLVICSPPEVKYMEPVAYSITISVRLIASCGTYFYFAFVIVMLPSKSSRWHHPIPYTSRRIIHISSWRHLLH